MLQLLFNLFNELLNKYINNNQFLYNTVKVLMYHYTKCKQTTSFVTEKHIPLAIELLFVLLSYTIGYKYYFICIFNQ